MKNLSTPEYLDDFRQRADRVASEVLNVFNDSALKEPATKADIIRLSLLVMQLTIAMRAYSVPPDDEDHKIWFEMARDVTKSVGKAARAIFEDAGGLSEEGDD